MSQPEVASLYGGAPNKRVRTRDLHLAKERSRSAYTLALVMVVMAMLLATGGLFLSVRDGIGQIVDRQFGADIFVQSRVPDDGTFGAKLAREPGAQQVRPPGQPRQRAQPSAAPRTAVCPPA